MPGLIDAPSLLAVIVWATLQGWIAQRLVSGVWQASLPWELGFGAMLTLLSYLVLAQEHGSRETLVLLGIALVVNSIAVLVAHRFPARDRVKL